MGRTTIELDERLAREVERAAAAEGVDSQRWVNDRIARALFLSTLDDVQRRNPEPLSEEQAAEVVYGP